MTSVVDQSKNRAYDFFQEIWEPNESLGSTDFKSRKNRGGEYWKYFLLRNQIFRYSKSLKLYVDFSTKRKRIINCTQSFL